MRLLVSAAVLLAGGCSTAYGTGDGPAPDATAGLDAGGGATDAGADASTSTADASGADAAAPTYSATLTVTRTGSGAGNGAVRSADLGIDCGATCTRAYGSGASVTLTATPLADGTFTGWGAPCSGTGKCTLVLDKDLTVSASFVRTVLDIDGNRAYDATTDAKLVSRYLFGLTGTALTDGAIGQGATRADPAAVLAYLTSIRPQLDIDGDGTMDGLTDGLLVERYLLGLRGAPLTNGATSSQATRNTAQIEAYLASLTPPL